jgi:biopolymer transport protein ExbD/biopolymer transport protein TolR
MAFALGGSSTHSEINVTPLIDVLLVLLIIFMVLVPAHRVGLRTQVPQPPKSQQQASDPPPVLVVEVADNGSAEPLLKLNSQPVRAEELSAKLAAVLAIRQDRTVFVRGDRTLTFAPVAQVLGVAKRAGAEPIALLGPQGR